MRPNSVIIRPHHRTHSTDAAYRYRSSSVVFLRVCGLWATIVSLAKTQRPIEIWNVESGRPKMQVLHVSPNPATKRHF